MTIRNFILIDKLIFLKVQVLIMFINGDFYKKKLRITGKGNKTMTDKQIENFVMYYERLTKHMLKTLSKKADTVISIDKNIDLNRLNLIK